jgi:hypothetical protein
LCRLAEQTWLPNPKPPIAEVHELIHEALSEEPEEEWRVVKGQRVQIRHMSDSERALGGVGDEGSFDR